MPQGAALSFAEGALPWGFDRILRFLVPEHHGLAPHRQLDNARHGSLCQRGWRSQIWREQRR